MTIQLKLLIIFNPLAGKKYHDKYQKFFLKYLNRFLPNQTYDWLDTQLDLDDQLARLDFSTYQKIMVIGGDGTIRQVAEFLIKNKIDLPLAIIPEGSANILAANLNLPLAMLKAIKVACLGKEKIIDVALINDKIFYLVCLSLGFWSKIIKETHRGLKIRWGNLAYVFTFLMHPKKYKTIFKFSLDGQDYAVPGNTMVVANALSIFKIKPSSPIDFTDGLLEVIIFQNSSLGGLLIASFSLLFRKKKFPLLFKARGKKIIISQETVMQDHLQLDGEPIELAKIKVEVVPSKLKMIVP
jgi:diacylglycerol kinase (ATP)